MDQRQLFCSVILSTKLSGSNQLFSLRAISSAFWVSLASSFSRGAIRFCEAELVFEWGEVYELFYLTAKNVNQAALETKGKR